MAAMRRINFRMWNPVNQTMLDECQDFGEFSEYLQTPELVIMQSTGLFDRKGKEIYEGDVYEFQNSNMSEPLRWVVGWCDLRACFTLDGLPIPDQCDEGYHLADRCTVIGNIYENPELKK